MKCAECLANIEGEAVCPACLGKLRDELAERERQLKLAQTWARTWHNAAKKAGADV